MFKQKLLLSLFLLALFLASGPNTFAADKDVVCTDSGCTGFSGKLFSETNLVPGDSASKTFSLKNDLPEQITLTLSAEENSGTDEALAKKSVAVVYDQASAILFSGTFENFLNADINLGNIDPNQTKTYEIEISFPKDSGNDYQGKVVNFDLSLTATGQISQTEQSTSSSTSDSDSDSQQGSILGTSTGSVLGLSDTGSIIKILLLGSFGFALILIGLKLRLSK